MESIKKEATPGILMGIVGVLLLGAIIRTLAMPVSDVLKLGGVIFDIGVAGLVWIFLDEAIESAESEIYRAILAIAAAILVAFAW